MKRILLGMAVLSVLPISAQTVVNQGGVDILLDSSTPKVGRDGKMTVGEAISIQSAWGRDNVTGDIFLFEAASLGDGNCITKDGWVVGTDKTVMHGALLFPDEISVPPIFSGYSESHFEAVTWDGKRICGHVANPANTGADEPDPDKQTAQFLPFYCDVNGSEISEPHLLPIPDKDLMGLVPQYVSAMWISDDGHTILGQYMDNSGNFPYPIIYKEDAEGNWSMTNPAERFINMTGLPVPVYPKPRLEAPEATDFIGDPELRELFIEMVEDWDGYDEASNPYNYLAPSEFGLSFMTQQEYSDYIGAVIEYQEYIYEYYAELDKYYEELGKFMANSYIFLWGSLSMNAAGTKISATRTISYLTNDQRQVKYHIPMVYDLETDEWETLADEKAELKITQILADGTCIAVSPRPNINTPDLTPVHTSVYPVGGEGFMPINEYLQERNPQYARWMNEYLFQKVPIGVDYEGNLVEIEMVATGFCGVSDDFNTVCGGVDTWIYDDEALDYVTYFLSDLYEGDNGIDEIGVKGVDNYTVFNLQGVKVMEGRSKEALSSLKKGIYIVNGKKLLVP